MPNTTRIASAALLASTLLLCGSLQAMTFQQFDKMSDDKQAEYVAALIQGAEEVLTDAGRTNEAAQVSKLFTTNLGNDKESIGMVEFMRNLARARADDAKNAVAHPNDAKLEVEDALFLTLKKTHITLPDSFYQQFDKMSDDKQAEYVAELIQVAEKVLTDDNQSDDAAKVSKLFTTNDPGDKISIGMTEFMRNLAFARVFDIKRTAQNPSAKHVEVEHAMIVTLKKNGIILPKSFMAAAKKLEIRFLQMQ